MMFFYYSDFQMTSAILYLEKMKSSKLYELKKFPIPGKGGLSCMRTNLPGSMISLINLGIKLLHKSGHPVKYQMCNALL
jgi:hypothetical protein